MRKLLLVILIAFSSTAFAQNKFSTTLTAGYSPHAIQFEYPDLTFKMYTDHLLVDIGQEYSLVLGNNLRVRMGTSLGMMFKNVKNENNPRIRDNGYFDNIENLYFRELEMDNKNIGFVNIPISFMYMLNDHYSVGMGYSFTRYFNSTYIDSQFGWEGPSIFGRQNYHSIKALVDFTFSENFEFSTFYSYGFPQTIEYGMSTRTTLYYNRVGIVLRYNYFNTKN